MHGELVFTTTSAITLLSWMPPLGFLRTWCPASRILSLSTSMARVQSSTSSMNLEIRRHRWRKVLRFLLGIVKILTIHQFQAQPQARLQARLQALQAQLQVRPQAQLQAQLRLQPLAQCQRRRQHPHQHPVHHHAPIPVESVKTWRAQPADAVLVISVAMMAPLAHRQTPRF